MADVVKPLSDVDTEEGFEHWVTEVGQVFKSLPGEKQNKLLDKVLNLSGPRQLYHLHAHLEIFLKRDFLTLLPLELSRHVLNFLDPWTLLICEEVSPRWKSVVRECRPVWRKACLEAGVPESALSANQDAAYYRKLYVHVRQRLDDLAVRGNEVFSQNVLHGHTQRVTALYYKDGQLATGSDDRTVKIWDCATGECVQTIKAHSVAALKFDSQRVVTASFDCTAASWDMKSGEREQIYRGHVAAVWALDYNCTLDVLVTGSADETVKIFSLAQGTLICTLGDAADKIAQVIILPLQTEDAGRHFAVVAQESDAVNLWKLSSETVESVMDYDIVTFKTWSSRMAGDTRIIPGLRINDVGTRASFTVQGQPTGAADERSYFFEQANLVNKMDKDETYPVFGVWAMSISPKSFWICGKRYQVCVREDHTQIEIRKHSMLYKETIPAGEFWGRFHLTSGQLRADSSRGSTYCLCNTSWIDGFDGHNDSGMFFAGATNDNGVLLLKWNPPLEHHTDAFVQKMTSKSIRGGAYEGVKNFTK